MQKACGIKQGASEEVFRLETLARWTIVLILSLPVGGYFAALFVRELRAYLTKKYGVTVEDEGKAEIPARLTSFIEQLFFTVAVASDMSGAAPAMVAWVALKMATGWNFVTSEKPYDRAFALSGLLGTTVSLFFAMVAGLLIRYRNWRPLISFILIGGLFYLGESYWLPRCQRRLYRSTS